MDILIQYETALHRTEFRSNQAVVEEFLHPDFREVGKSGHSFNFHSITALIQPKESNGREIHSQNYECTPYSESVQLLLYHSARRDQQENYTEYCKRAPIWVLNKNHWQMKYHQGTPFETFEIVENISAKQLALNL